MAAKVGIIKWGFPHKCVYCHKESPISFVLWQDFEDRVGFCDDSLCPCCVATLHALTSPLSVLIQTGEDIEKDLLE